MKALSCHDILLSFNQYDIHTANICIVCSEYLAIIQATFESSGKQRMNEEED